MSLSYPPDDMQIGTALDLVKQHGGGQRHFELSPDLPSTGVDYLTVVMVRIVECWLFVSPLAVVGGALLR